MDRRPLSTARWAIVLVFTLLALVHLPPTNALLPLSRQPAAAPPLLPAVPSFHPGPVSAGLLPALPGPLLGTTDHVAFVDDFQGGSTARWVVQPGWSAGEEGGNGYLHAAAAGQATLVQPLTRSQYRLRADVRLVGGSAALWYRRSFDGTHGYRLHVAPDGLRLYRWQGDGNVTLLGADPAPIPAGTWHTLQISGTLGHLQVWVDGNPRIDLDDPQAWYAGSIALETVGESPVVDFDAIEIWVPVTDEPAWEQTGGPDGGYFATIELDPTAPQTLYAGGNGGAVFRSTDGGASWAMLPAFTTAGNTISDLLLSPSDAHLLHARLMNGEFLTSSDAGSTWHRANQPGLFTCCVAMYRPAPSHLLAAGGSTVYYSDNNGRDWSDVTGDLLAASQIASLAMTGSAEFWAGTTSGTGGTVYHTVDGGVHWQAVSTIGQDATLNAEHMFVPPQVPGTLYVGFGESYATPSTVVLDRLFVTTDGAAWTPISLPMPTGRPDIIGQSVSDDTFFLSLHSELWKSANGGQDWTPIDIPYWIVDPYDIAIHPASSQVLYLPRRSTGLLKSTDGGATWSEIRQGLRNTAVIHLAVPPRPGSSLLYSDGYVSADRGDSWTYFIDNGIDHPFIDDIVVHPRNPDAVWLAVDNGTTFTTTNRGATWTKAIAVTGGSGFRFGSIYAAAMAPSDADRIYVLRNGLGILSSSDGGHAWDNLKTSGVDYTYSLAVHPTDPDTVYSGYTPKPFQDWAYVRKTVDAGLTWTTALSVAHSTGFTTVAIDPQSPSTVYAGSTGGEGVGGQIYVTRDAGLTWDELNEHLTMLTVWGQPQLLIDAADPDTVYAATWLGGTWTSTDAGLTWERLKGAPVSSTALSQGGGAVLYAADRTRPVLWKSTDGGKTWAAAADFAAAGAFLLNRVLADGKVVYASTFGPTIHGGRLYRSPDAGTSWTDITGTLPRSVLDVALDPTDPQTVYVTTHIHGAFKSVDGGTTWVEMNEFPHIGGYDIEVDPVTPNVLYAAGMGTTTVPAWVMPPAGHTLSDPSGVYKSIDGGLHWDPILTTANECRAIRLHPDHHDWLFAAALDSGLYASTNGGGSWTQYNTGLDTLNLTSVAVNGTKIYAGTQGMGVYAGDVNLSTGAVTWQTARSNKPVPAVYSLYLVVDPTNSDRVYVGSNPGGLFRSDDGGITWYDKNFLTPSVVPDDSRRQGYYTFALNPHDPSEVWLGTWGKGIYKSFDGMDFDIGANGQDQAMLSKHVNAVLVDPHYGVLVATEEGVWRTIDGGEEWSAFSDGLGTPQVRTLSGNGHGRLFAGTAGYELYTRTPDDTSWTQLPDLDNWGDLWPIWDDRPNYQYTSFLLDRADPDTIYAGTFPAGVWKSTDGGRTWLERNVGFTFDGIFYLVAHPDDPDTIYAGTYNGVNYTRDGGAHWEKRDAGWPGEQWVFSIAFDPRTPRVMVACSKNGEDMGRGRPGFHGMVMKTIDGGGRWFPITNGLNVNQEFYEIVADKFQPDTYYLATQYEGVFVTRDGGKLWLPWNEGLTNESAATNGNNVTSPMVLSADGRYLYFGTAGSAAFRKQIVSGWTVYLPVVLRASPF